MINTELIEMYSQEIVDMIYRFAKEKNYLVGEIEVLQEKNEELRKCYCNRTDCAGRINDSRKYTSLEEENERLKQALKKIRECIKKHQRKDEQLYLNEWQVRDILQTINKVSNDE